MVVCFFQAEDGIRVLVRSRGRGDVYKRQTSAQDRDYFFESPEAALASIKIYDLEGNEVKL